MKEKKADKREIKILGAGISGLTAAINLAKAGYKVTVYEKNKDCGMRFHEDFQGLENWSVEKNVLDELKEMNIRIDFKNYPHKTMTIIDGNHNKVHKASKRVLFYWVKRGCVKDSLDLNLKKQALGTGVKIIFNSKIDFKEVDIISTGPKRVGAVVKGISFDTKHKNTFVTQINDDSSYKGYSYMLIINGHGTIVTGLIPGKQDINKQFNEVKKYFFKHYNLKIKNKKEWANFANFSLKGPYRYKGKLLTGEAAGLQDGWFGFGMRTAFVSGYLAARSIIERKSYKRMVKRRYSNYLKNGLVNRYLWERMGNRGYHYLIDALKFQGDFFYFLKVVYDYTFFKRLIYPIAYNKYKKKGHYKIKNNF